MKTQNYKPTGWQLNPNYIDTEKVQYWTNGIMITLINKRDAIEMVSNHQAFVISAQAIGQLDENGYSLS